MFYRPKKKIKSTDGSKTYTSRNKLAIKWFLWEMKSGRDQTKVSWALAWAINPHSKEIWLNLGVVVMGGLHSEMLSCEKMESYMGKMKIRIQSIIQIQIIKQDWWSSGWLCGLVWGTKIPPVKWPRGKLF